MDRKIISYRIANIRDNLMRLNNYICAMESLDIQHYPENYEKMSTESALKAEKIACQLRSLLYASTSISKSNYLLKAGEVHDIEITYENGIVEISLPRLLPKKKTKQSSLFLIDPLHTALEQYATLHFLPRYRECVVCISHVYDYELPNWYLLDYDNLQQKQLLDVIALHIMVDDSGLLCDTYNTTVLGDKNYTHIYIMEKNRFSGWILEQEKRMKSISDF